MSNKNSERPLREVVASRLRSMIVEGELKPGERLVEGQLAERLGVSRNPVREAMRSLEATGLIEVVPRRGAHVSTVDPCAVHHIQRIRILVEGYALEQAARRKDPDAVKRIRRCLDDGRRATENGDAVAAAAHHREFHLAVEEAAGIPFLNQVLDPLRNQTEMVFSLVTDERGHITWEEHEAIYEAVASGNAECAKELWKQHVVNALESFEQTMTPAAAGPET